MSYRAELACAARAVNALAERIPADNRPDLAREWDGLMDRLDSCHSDGVRALEIIAWRQELGERLSVRLAHSPLEGESA